MKYLALLSLILVFLTGHISTGYCSITGVSPNPSGDTYIDKNTSWIGENIKTGGNIWIGSGSKEISILWKDSTVEVPGNIIINDKVQKVEFKIENTEIILHSTEYTPDRLFIGNNAKYFLMDLGFAPHKLTIIDSTIGGSDSYHRALGVRLRDNQGIRTVIIENTTFKYMGGMVPGIGNYGALDTHCWSEVFSTFSEKSRIRNLKFLDNGWSMYTFDTFADITGHNFSVISTPSYRHHYGIAWDDGGSFNRKKLYIHDNNFESARVIMGPFNGTEIYNNNFTGSRSDSVYRDKTFDFRYPYCNVHDNNFYRVMITFEGRTPGSYNEHAHHNRFYKVSINVNRNLGYNTIEYNTFEGEMPGASDQVILDSGHHNKWQHNIVDLMNLNYHWYEDYIHVGYMDDHPVPCFNTIYNNTIKNISSNKIAIWLHSNSYQYNISKNKISNVGYGIVLENTHDNTLTDNTVTGSKDYGLKLKNCRDTKFIYGFYDSIKFAGGNSNNKFIGTDYTTVSFDDNIDQLNMYNFLSFDSSDNDFNVSVYDKNNNLLESKVTTTGEINNMEILEFIEKQAGKTTYYPHKIKIQNLNPNKKFYLYKNGGYDKELTSDAFGKIEFYENIVYETKYSLQETGVTNNPVADAGFNQTANLGDSVSFDGSNSNDTDGSIVSYEWDFGDGNAGTGVTVSHTYAAPGEYEVILTVRDNDGLEGTDIVYLFVNAPPTAEAGVNQTVTRGIAFNLAILAMILMVILLVIVGILIRAMELR